MICFCCNNKTDHLTFVGDVPICDSCKEFAFVIYDSYLGVYAVNPEDEVKEFNAMREYAKLYLDKLSARQDISLNLGSNERFKIVPYNHEICFHSG